MDNKSIFLDCDKVLNKNEFSLMIEEKAAELEIGCLELLIDCVEKDYIAMESLDGLLNSRLLAKIEAEASSLNLLSKKKSLKFE